MRTSDSGQAHRHLPCNLLHVTCSLLHARRPATVVHCCRGQLLPASTAGTGMNAQSNVNPSLIHMSRGGRLDPMMAHGQCFHRKSRRPHQRLAGPVSCGMTHPITMDRIPTIRRGTSLRHTITRTFAFCTSFSTRSKAKKIPEMAQSQSIHEEDSSAFYCREVYHHLQALKVFHNAE